MAWWHSMIPMGIIGGMLLLMGHIPHWIHVSAHGKPKPVRNDKWDKLMDDRDRRLIERAEQEEAAAAAAAAASTS